MDLPNFIVWGFMESKEEGKDQESVQSNSTPEWGHHKEKWQKGLHWSKKG